MKEKSILEPIYIKAIEEYYEQGVSLAGITSLLYYKGVTGIQYMELRKNCV
jgi:hypothetical protein